MGVVTFDGAPPEGTINFGVGQPSADLLPVELVGQASAAFFAEAQSLELNYGVTAGDERFLESLAGFLERGYGGPVSAENLFVTGGNSQALDLVSTVLAKPGDTVFVEEPSYFLAFQILRDHGLNIVGIPLDDDGIVIEALEQALENHSPSFLYTIPSYQNPGGQCLTLERRQKLVELSLKHDFLLVCDDVYQLLYFDDPPPPPLIMLEGSDNVVSMGSFSKILAPGMRLGWIQCAAPLRQKLEWTGFVNSGGSINHISSHIVRHAIDLGLQEQHLLHVRQAYAARVDAMQHALEEHFSELARWEKPGGGYFFWLEFDPSLDLTPLRDKAAERETGFSAGSMFSPEGRLGNYMRLSFAHWTEEQISDGIARLRALFD